MKIVFCIAYSTLEDKQIIGFVKKHDPDYASLMIYEHNPSRINYNMLEKGRYGSYFIGLEVLDQKAKDIILNLMTKSWCHAIYKPGDDPQKTEPFYFSNCEHAHVTGCMNEFMAASINRPWGQDFKNGAEAAAKMRNLMHREP